MKIQTESRIPEMCKRIVEVCTYGGKVNWTEVDKRLAMMVADEVLDTIKYISITQPNIIVNYNTMNDEQKLRYDKLNEDWRSSAVVQDWIKKDSSAKAENQSNIHWLNKWRNNVKDDVRKSKFTDKLKEFKQFEPISPVKTHSEPKIQRVLDIFDGEIVKSV